MKLAVVGCEASGKTVFMSALADFYRQPELCLVPENPAANKFARFEQRQMRGLGEWPPATDPERTIDLKWTLRENGNVLAELEMLEFGGETFRAAFREEENATEKPEKSAAVQVLLDYLSNADYVVVLISLKELFNAPGNGNQAEYDRTTEAIWVTRGLLNFIKNNLPNAGTVVALTQADRYRNELAEFDNAQAALTAHWPDIAALTNDAVVVALASVSRTDKQGKPAKGFKTNGVLAVMDELKKMGFANPDYKKKPKKAAKKSGTNATNGNSGQFNMIFLVFGMFCVFIAVLILMMVFALRLNPTLNLPAFQSMTATTEPDATNARASENRHELPTAGGTNAIDRLTESTGIATNLNANSEANAETAENATLPDMPETPMPPSPIINELREWHDYRGRSIFARWMNNEINENGERRIILEAENGRLIRAVIHKFSEDDQNFITNHPSMKLP